ncbi:holliday junction resolvase [Microbacterium phage Lynlen]|uniref:holliday junction resolvase n=1 Tax=Microbacterium phage Lynlen TaxID=2725651 RepID=UPI001462BC7A|nr:holliday junction resolvase [Microbacterium phage Lynlen]YP_010753533.1 holliday junction resolvase [Microbacterium phage Kenzers]QJD53446.1 holliday junction resolvase [Microbacterium phage Lynlen]UVT31666.1 holliday junction resolvase [Microbacterium phage Kenzers]
MDGQRFERDLEKTFRAAGIQALRPRQDRVGDVGDLHVASDVVVQAKAWKNLAEGVRVGVAGAQAQKRRAGRPIGVAIVKQGGKRMGEAVVALPLSDFIALLKSREAPE